MGLKQPPLKHFRSQAVVYYEPSEEIRKAGTYLKDEVKKLVSAEDSVKTFQKGE